MLKLYREKTAYDFLRNDCWEVDDLVDAIRDNDCEEAFNNLMDEIFPDIKRFGEFQDYCRFSADEIKNLLGISDESEDDDEQE